MKLTFVGDFYPSKRIINNYFEKKFILDKLLINLFKDSDYSFLNLESPILNNPRNLKKNLKFADNLYLPECSVNIIKDLNISHACLANNHIMDYGYEGLNNTIRILKKNNINYLGIVSSDFYKESKPLIIKNNKVKIAVFNTAEGEEGSIRFNKYGVLFNNNFDLFNQIKTFKNRGFFIIMVVHGGNEHIDCPPPHIIDLYRNYCLFGCDVVVGHHPHVPQGYEEFNNSKIFYSLGNFLMNKDCWKSKARIGQILTLDISENSFLTTLNYLEINDNYLKLYNNESIKNMNKLLTNDLKNKDQIWDSYVDKKYNPFRFFIKGELFLFNFSRVFLKAYNFLCTPSHQFGLQRWLILNKRIILKGKESNSLKIFIFIERSINKIKRIFN